MNIDSLGFETNLIFSKFSGEVLDMGSYTLIQTPTNPGYHWGNYIIFDRTPKPGDHKSWVELFNKEFPYYSEPHHYVFAWQGSEEDKGDVQEFLAAGFEADSALVLTASELNPPAHLNDKVEVRKIVTDEQWTKIEDLQVSCAHEKYINDYYREFKRLQMLEYRKMSEAGLGFWFGAYINDQLVGDCGIFHNNQVGRYQNVGTYPEYRRQGICGTLVYKTGLIALKEFGIKYLVMEADPEYHAARIYESVGFKRSEVNYSVSWWRR